MSAGAPRRRFFAGEGALDGSTVVLDGALAHRLGRVLRLRAGDEVTLFDGSGTEARARLDRIDDRSGEATVVERFDGVGEPPVRISLYQSITKGERFEWLVEKATEIGVARFVPVIAARAVVKTAADASRVDRWRRIAIEAAEQCGRSRVPVVEPPQRFDDALASAPGVRLLPYEEAGDRAPAIAEALNGDIDTLFALAEVSIMIGPEGGYEPAEVQRAAAAGATTVTLGRRILRSETAGLIAATLVLQAIGEF